MVGATNDEALVAQIKDSLWNKGYRVHPTTVVDIIAAVRAASPPCWLPDIGKVVKRTTTGWVEFDLESLPVTLTPADHVAVHRDINEHLRMMKVQEVRGRGTHKLLTLLEEHDLHGDPPAPKPYEQRVLECLPRDWCLCGDKNDDTFQNWYFIFDSIEWPIAKSCATNGTDPQAAADALVLMAGGKIND